MELEVHSFEFVLKRETREEEELLPWFRGQERHGTIGKSLVGLWLVLLSRIQFQVLLLLSLITMAERRRLRPVFRSRDDLGKWVLVGIEFTRIEVIKILKVTARGTSHTHSRLFASPSERSFAPLQNPTPVHHHILHHLHTTSILHTCISPPAFHCIPPPAYYTTTASSFTPPASPCIQFYLELHHQHRQQRFQFTSTICCLIYHQSVHLELEHQPQKYQ